MVELGLSSLNCLSVFLDITAAAPELLKTRCGDVLRSSGCVLRAVLLGLRFKHITVSFAGWVVDFVDTTAAFRGIGI